MGAWGSLTVQNGVFRPGARGGAGALLRRGRRGHLLDLRPGLQLPRRRGQGGVPGGAVRGGGPRRGPFVITPPHVLVHTQNPYRRSKCILNNDSAPSYIRRRAGRAAGTAPPAGSPTAAAVRPVHPRLRGAPPLLRRSGAARRRARRGRRVLLELPVRLRLPGRLGQAAARRPSAAR
jgi:hypothetical protein